MRSCLIVPVIQSSAAPPDTAVMSHSRMNQSGEYWPVSISVGSTAIVLFSAVYLLLFAVFLFLLNDKIRHGPDESDLIPAGKLALPNGKKP